MKRRAYVIDLGEHLLLAVGDILLVLLIIFTLLGACLCVACSLIVDRVDRGLNWIWVRVERWSHFKEEA